MIRAQDLEDAWNAAHAGDLLPGRAPHPVILADPGDGLPVSADVPPWTFAAWVLGGTTGALVEPVLGTFGAIAFVVAAGAVTLAGHLGRRRA